MGKQQTGSGSRRRAPPHERIPGKSLAQSGLNISDAGAKRGLESENWKSSSAGDQRGSRQEEDVDRGRIVVEGNFRDV